MNNIEKRFAVRVPRVNTENITAVLTCLGAQTTPREAEYIAERQNPFRQKRGGLGDGVKAVIALPDGRREFTNINIDNEQARLSPLTLRVQNEESGAFQLADEQNGQIARGKVLPTPPWGTKILSTGKPAIAVLQQHGPRNLVGILGETTCSLF